MAKPEFQTLQLHRDAPDKPPHGAPCNRCGVCCAAEPCPVGQLIFRQRRGACPALEWQGTAYACALLTNPERTLSWLPKRWWPLAQRCFSRWIAAGKGCDSTSEVWVRSP